MAKFESKYCPVNETLKIISGKWHLLIIRDLFFGKKRFKEFKKDKPNLSNKVLTECLKDLESNGLISKTNLDDSKITEYSLTEEGRKMNRILYELAIFTLKKDDSATDAESEEFIKIFKDTLDID
ncbi:winged helix-turn-helix transcriptional regulator [Methanobrevibacter sp.]|uniref:winged helix-turn-helix transcriptional regulator n=1 Tax=Methanobrevibacter sp. TaxID=66852 RepID=UPI003866CDD6